MKQSTNPIESLVRIVIVGVFAICTMLYFIKAAASDPTPSMDSYTDAVVKEYQDSTRHAQEVETYLKANNLK